MSTAHTLMRCGAALAVALVTMGASAQTPSALTAVAQVDVVPRHHQWSLIAPEARPALEQLVQMSSADLDRLLTEGDARQRGIGLFIAEQQGDLTRLLALAHWLDDNKRTVAYALPVAQVGEYAHDSQTVGEYLDSIYREWFGVDVDTSRKRFEKFFGDVSEPEHLVRPWIVRLRRAQADAAKVAEIKQRISALPEDVRWAVVTSGYTSSVYSEAEARAILSNLSEPTRSAIEARAELLPDEPLFRMNHGTHRKLLLRESQRLLASPRK